MANKLTYYGLFMLLISVSMISACGRESPPDNDALKGTFAVPLPAGSQAVGAIKPGDYIIHIIIDGNYGKPYVLTNLRYDAEHDMLVGDSTITLSAKEHTIEVIYYIDDSQYGLTVAASTVARTITVAKNRNTRVPISSDAVVYDDTDSDGITNLDELLRRSNPNNSDSTPGSPLAAPDGLSVTVIDSSFQLNWTATAGMKYDIYYGTSVNLSTGSDSVQLIGTNSYTFTSANFDMLATYYFAVRMVDDNFKISKNGNSYQLKSPLSNSVSGTLCTASNTPASALPAQGNVASTGTCYAVEGLVGNRSYAVGLYDLSDNVNLNVLAINGTSGCSSEFDSNESEVCVATTNADGKLWIHASKAAGNIGNNSTFTLNVLPVSDLTGKSSVHSSLVSDGDSRSYAVTGLTANGEYAIKGDNYSGDDLLDGEISAMQNPFLSPACRSYILDTCFLQANGRGEIFFQSSLITAYAGTTNSFDLSITAPAALPANTVSYQGVTVYAKTEVTNNRGNMPYTAGNLAGGTDYLVTVGKLTGDLDLYVYGGNFNQQFACASENFDIAAEYCLARAIPGNKLYINVSPFTDLSANLYLSNSSGFDIAAFPVTTREFPADGQYFRDNAYDTAGIKDRLYVFRGLISNGNYLVYLSHLNDDADLAVFNQDPSQPGTPQFPPPPFSEYVPDYHCGSFALGTVDDFCNATATLDGELFALVYPQTRGISFHLVVMQRIGASVSDSISSANNGGSTEREDRFYVFTGLDSSLSYTIKLTGEDINADGLMDIDLDLYIYPDGSFQTVLASARTTNAVESLVVQPNSNGTVYARIAGYEAGTSTFTLSR